MQLARLVHASREVGATRSRRQKVALLSACLSALAPEEIEIGVSFLSGELRQGRIGVGYAGLHALSAPAAADPSLELREVDATFERIASLRGAGSGGERERQLLGLFARASAEEQDFLRRLLVGELRQGALEGVMLDAIAEACAVPAAAVRRAVMLSAQPGAVARAARERGGAGLEQFKLELFRPLQPMLAQSASDVRDALARLSHAAFEWKLDGARVQVHRAGEDVRVFTRTGNDVTAAVPEVVLAARALPARTLVLDGEAIALEPGGRPRSFQTTMKRFGRKLDVERMRAELPLSCFFFDLLHLDGQDLIDVPASERARAFEQLVPAAMRVERATIEDAGAAEAFLARALAAGHEGLVAKSLDASYEAGRRGAGWLKIKSAHTLDLVVLAVEWGSGRRKGWLSNLHLGARAANGEFVMLGKTFKGMTDEMLAWQTAQLLALETSRDAYTVYVRPELVVEIAFDGLQESPHYPGGLALRFARVKGYRPDKPASEADTIETVRALASLQPF
jgi:DNA ligase-1